MTMQLKGVCRVGGLAVGVAVLLMAVAPAAVIAQEAPAKSTVQPECGRCGCTDLTFAHAVGAGWVKVQGLVSCRLCASGFPAWMHGPI